MAKATRIKPSRTVGEIPLAQIATRAEDDLCTLTIHLRRLCRNDKVAADTQNQVVELRKYLRRANAALYLTRLKARGVRAHVPKMGEEYSPIGWETGFNLVIDELLQIVEFCEITVARHETTFGSPESIATALSTSIKEFEDLKIKLGGFTALLRAIPVAITGLGESDDDDSLVPADPFDVPTLSFDKNTVEVLKVMATFTAFEILTVPMVIERFLPEKRPGETKVGEAINQLIDEQFAERPKGKDSKSGARLNRKGRKLAATISVQEDID